MKTLTEPSGIHSFTLSVRGLKLRKPMQESRVSATQARIVWMGRRATCQIGRVWKHLVVIKNRWLIVIVGCTHQPPMGVEEPGNAGEEGDLEAGQAGHLAARRGLLLLHLGRNRSLGQTQIFYDHPFHTGSSTLPQRLRNCSVIDLRNAKITPLANHRREHD